MLVLIVPLGAFMLFSLYWQRRQNKGDFQPLSPSEIPSERFEDVIGADEILDESRQIVRCLRRPRWFRLLGVRPLTGMLIFGLPGTGKTLLARAIAGEAGVPFYAVNGSDFDDQYMGVGARRVRQLFDDARSNPVAIIFIDEIDSVGGKRGSNTDSGTVGYNQTVNALLAEMDGFAGKRTGPMIIVIGATNGPERIDPALTRPGRLTRQLNMPAPDRLARLSILKMYAKRLPNVGDEAGLFEELASLTGGMSGADLAELVNQAGLTAEREYNAQRRAAAEAAGEPYVETDEDVDTPGYMITKHHFMQALESAELGPERKSIQVAQHDRRVTAAHEAGHAVAGRFAKNPVPPRKVSIVSRGPAGGVTWATSSDRELLGQGELFSRLVYFLGARAAERLILGDDEYTFGAHDDLAKATKLAQAMICEYAMDDRYPAQLPLYDGDPRHEAIHDLLRQALEEATRIVTQHRAEVEAIMNALLEHETLGGEELAELLPA
jgi:cell division protease FtsH